MLILDKTLNNIYNYDEWLEITNTQGSAMLINKESNWTSFDVIAKLRNIVKLKKIGHCGTLDPFATGLLILCLGKGTKQISTFQNLPKQYYATIKLGATTKSFDIEQKEENIKDITGITENQIQDALNKFVGTIEQIPPMFSAKKINGERLYELARKDMELELKPVQVDIYSIELQKIELPFISILIDCSKGTYIRALARDIGSYLGVGAYLTQLCRTKIGDYSYSNAFTVNEIKEHNLFS